MTKLQLFIEGVEVDLFKDEIVTVNSSVANVQDISKVFSDFSQSFVVPASPRNNRIFQHWYESDVMPTIDHNLRRDAFIEIEMQPFRVGKIQLNEAVIKDGQVVSYSLNFFGALTSLKDRFGELTLKDLDYSSIAFVYNGTNVYNRLTDGTTSYDIRFPLVASDRLWTFGTSGEDISTTAKAVVWDKLFPAVRVNAIFNIIETQFGINFSSLFFQTAKWLDLYARYQNTEKFSFIGENQIVDLSSNVIAGSWVVAPTINTTENTITIPYQAPDFLPHNVQVSTYFYDNANAQVYCDVYLNDVLFSSTAMFDGAPPAYSYCADIPNEVGNTQVIKLFFRSTQTVNFDYEVLISNPSNTRTITIDGNETTTVNINASLFAPSVKIADFVSAIFKAFNLVCVGENENTFTIEPLQDWYTLGSEKDITKYVINSSNVKRLPLYKQIAFKYKESKSFVNKNFLSTFNRSYGDLDYAFDYDGTEFKIELPFENIQFTELKYGTTDSDLFVAFTLDEKFSPYVPELALMYLNGEATSNPAFKFFDGTSNLNVTDYALFNSVNTTGFSLCFGNEFNIVTQETEPNSLYQTYYANHLGNLYDLQQRLFGFTAVLPTGVLSSLKLNDKLIIKDKRYIINDMTTTLNNGVVQLNLIRELVTFEPSCAECVRVSFTYEGVEYSFDVPKIGVENGKNRYEQSNTLTDEVSISIVWYDDLELWEINIGINSISSTYRSTTDSILPYLSDWNYFSGETVDGLEVTETTTTVCDCVNLSFVFEGTTYSGKMIHTGYINGEFIYRGVVFNGDITLSFDGSNWVVNSLPNGDVGSSISLYGVYETTEVTNLTTTPCYE